MHCAQQFYCQEFSMDKVCPRNFTVVLFQIEKKKNLNNQNAHQALDAGEDRKRIFLKECSLVIYVC